MDIFFIAMIGGLGLLCVFKLRRLNKNSAIYSLIQNAATTISPGAVIFQYLDAAENVENISESLAAKEEAVIKMREYKSEITRLGLEVGIDVMPSSLSRKRFLKNRHIFSKNV